MAYDKQTFSDGEVLTATKLNHMEDGIEAAHNANPPSCNFPAYSKVLSNGINGPEWVDIPASGGDGGAGSVRREFKDDALVDPTWFYELYNAYTQGLIAEIYCVDDTSTMAYLCVGSNVGELIFQRSEGDTVETLYLYEDGVITRSTNTAILYTPQTLSEEQKAQARANIGVAQGEGKYELIETITVTEPMSISRSAEPDGTPYKFRGLRVFAISNASQQALIHFFLYNSQKSSYAQGTFGSIAAGNTATQYAYVQMENAHGLWQDSWFQFGSNPGASAWFANSYRTLATSTDSSKYDYVASILSSTAVAAGTTIEIWGWRYE